VEVRAKFKDKRKGVQYLIGTFVSLDFDPGDTETVRDTSASDIICLWKHNCNKNTETS
jgi:hypothetical protein